MFTQIMTSRGIGITISGIIFIFLGLVLIAIVISLFNRYFNKQEKISKKNKDAADQPRKIANLEEIPEDELAAIATAIEVYRRIHYTQMLKDITFKHGDSRSPWKTGYKFSNKNF